MKTVIATGNKNKVREFKEILGDFSHNVLSMEEAGIDCEIVEDGDNFIQNALIKARAVKKYWDGIVIADDSGLVIDALGGKPGVMSSRFMGEDTPYEKKCKAIIDELNGVSMSKRSARFVCAMAIILPDGREMCVEETMEGIIALEPAGENGFGYDPIFYLPERGCTSAELTPDEKNSISHRGKALRELRKLLLSVKEIAFAMKRNSVIMAASSHETRIQALKNIKLELNKDAKLIFEANSADVERAKESGIAESVIKRLRFDEGKLEAVISGIDTLIELPDPIGIKTLRRQLSEDLILQRLSVPIGVIGVIFEARPDALVQIASLCIKSGNMCILKGGKETEETNAALFESILRGATKAGLPENCLARVSKHNEIDELLTCDKSVDLIIPRGSNSFVQYIMANTQIPVLGHADGICHTYVDKSCDLDMAVKICLDAKTQYPAACNATETLLVHKDIADRFLPKMFEAFTDAGVIMYGEKPVKDIINCNDFDFDDYKKEYLDFAISIKIVADEKEAVSHINDNGSHHTDAVITNDENVWKYFSSMVDSAGVYRNASTRFADGFRYGFGAEVGISTSKIHARGPVGLDGLMTYKYLLEGTGHTVGEFESKSKVYSFKDLD